eukprot:5899322-Prorocentrum_lima.AAC.1
MLPIVSPHHCPDVSRVPASLPTAPGNAVCVALHGAEELLRPRLTCGQLWCCESGGVGVGADLSLIHI